MQEQKFKQAARWTDAADWLWFVRKGETNADLIERSLMMGTDANLHTVTSNETALFALVDTVFDEYFEEDVKIAKVLIRHGLNVCHRDTSGRQALQYGTDNSELAILIRSHCHCGECSMS